MPHRKPEHFEYAQAPVFQYQTFDREDIIFSGAPTLPLSSQPMRIFGQVADDEPPKHDEEPSEAGPETIDMSSPEAETESGPAGGDPPTENLTPEGKSSTLPLPSTID